MIVNYFTLVTTLPNDEIAAVEAGLRAGSLNPMTAKKRLAWAIVAELNDAAAADAAQAEFERVFQRREDPSATATPLPLPLSEGRIEVDITQVLTQAGAIASRSEARRLLSQGAIAVNGEALALPRVALAEGDIVRVGRHRFLRIVAQ
jgi:tyrosyl-tRNA synthetase